MSPDPTPLTAEAPTAGWDRAWEDALAELELDLETTEEMLRRLHSGAELPSSDEVQRSRWTPPVGLGPLPLPLAERARLIVTRQQEVALRLAEATTANRRQAHLASSLRTAAPASAAYVDVAM